MTKVCSRKSDLPVYKILEESSENFVRVSVNDSDLELFITEEAYEERLDAVQRIKYPNIKNIRVLETSLFNAVISESKNILNNDLNYERSADLDVLIGDAIRAGVSDIHIEKKGTGVSIFYRINGFLTHVQDWALDDYDRFANSVYNYYAKQQEDTTLKPQSSQYFSIIYENKEDNVRAVVRGQTSSRYDSKLTDAQSMVMRVLVDDNEYTMRSLTEMGFTREQDDFIKKQLNNPTGAIIVSGKTGSGKNTTLVNLMSQMHSIYPAKSYRTIEQPVEYTIPFAAQQSIKDTDDGGYGDALKTIVRLDPDVIMLGELRDSITAKSFLNIVYSGHKVFTTIHANSPIGVLKRLVRLGLDEQQILQPGLFNTIVSQTLVPVLCRNCRIEPNEDSMSYKKGSGCEDCMGLGIEGREVVADVLPVTNEVLIALQSHNFQEIERVVTEVKQNYGLPLTQYDHGNLKFQKGIIDSSTLASECSNVI